jgi:hypothetical protein
MMGSSERNYSTGTSQSRSDGQPALPSSAPVSSLLPPIPTNHGHLLQHHLQASIQAQIAALLNHGAQQSSLAAPSGMNLVAPAVNSSHFLAAAAAAAAGANPAIGVVPPNPVLQSVDMHGWSVEQIGTVFRFVLSRLKSLKISHFIDDKSSR